MLVAIVIVLIVASLIINLRRRSGEGQAIHPPNQNRGIGGGSVKGFLIITLLTLLIVFYIITPRDEN